MSTHSECVSADEEAAEFRWFGITEILRKQGSIIGNSYPLILAAAAINYTYFYNGIANETATIEWIGSVNILVASIWYIGACTGSIISGFNRYPWSIRITNCICGCFLLIASVLLCVRDLFFQDIYVLTCVARFLAGSSFGFLIPVTTAQIGDNVWKMIRGYVASITSKSLITGLFVAILFNDQTWESSSFQYHMVLYFVIIGVSAYVIISCQCRGESESITRLLQANTFNEAESTFKNLFDNQTDPEIIRSEMDDKFIMMSEDYGITDHSSLHVFHNGNWKPIFWMILLRLLSVLTTNIRFIVFSGELVENFIDDTKPIELIHLYLIFFRLIGSVLPKFILDKSGRKYPLLISGIGSGFLFCLAILTSGVQTEFQSKIMAAILIFFVHIFASFGIDSTQNLYAAEAFPLSKRMASMAIVTCFEYIAHGIIIGFWFFDGDIILHYMILASPVCIILITILLFTNLPETKSKSLRQCRARFNKFYYCHLIQSRSVDI